MKPSSAAPTSRGKVAVSRFELFLIIFLLLSGLGAWVLIASAIDASTKGQEPIERRYQLQPEMAQHQSELVAVESALKTSRDQLAERRLDLLRQTMELEVLRRAHAGLPESSALTDLVAVGPEDLRAYLDVRAQQHASTTAIEMLQSQLSALITATAELSTTLTRPLAPRDRDMVSMRLEIARAEMGLIQQKLAEHQVNLMEQSATLQRIESRNAALAHLPPLDTVSPDVLQDYIKLQRDRESSERMIRMLEPQIKAHEAILLSRSLMTVADSRSAAQAFQNDQQWLVLKKHGMTFAGAMLVTVILLLVVLFIITRLRQVFNVDRGRVVVATILGLLALFVYQIFPVSATALVGGLLLIALLSLVLIAYWTRAMSKAS